MAWRMMRVVATAGLLAALSAGCTVVLRDPGVTNGCAPIRYFVTTNSWVLSADRGDAIDDAVAEFAATVGRGVEEVDGGGAGAASSRPGEPIVFELYWPDDAPHALGYAEPHIVDGRYAGGWVLLNPMLRNAPAGVIRRVVLHELGHLHGLADVDDPEELMDPTLSTSSWGPGDLVGLALTHNGGCQG